MSTEHNGYGVSAETFQAIIQERKAEKNRRAREERAQVLNSILERKSKSGINPLEKLPKEVWEMILDKLQQPKDLGNVSQVHVLFEDLVEKRKIRDMLFPPVLGLHIQTNPDPHAEILPLARDLNMRLLSKSMRNGIDRWYANNLLSCLRTGKNTDLDAMPTIHLSNSNVLKGLLENFRDSGLEEPKATRFVQRSLSSGLPATYARDRNNICSSLEVIGDQVWHFKYYVGSIEFLEFFGMNPRQIYDTLVECLQFMPNLKWLTLHVEEGGWQRKGVSIACHLANHPFPTLQHLERLDIELDSEAIVVFEIYAAILSANRHLKQLHINGDRELLERLPAALILDIHSLEAFCVGDDYDDYFNWHSIRTLVTFHWNLKKLRLSFGLHEYVALTDVVRLLENFQTLEHVALNIKKVWITGHLHFLKLPNLTDLELMLVPIIDFQSSNTIQFFFSLQFLLYCKKLKKLRWESRNGTDEQDTEI